jgi:DNA-binding transcriptional LysR family regulator
MELRWLDDFLALADTSNFTRAAAQRFSTQPAFSRRIRALELWLGAPLFDRKLQPVTLTRAGEAFLPRARALQRGAQEAQAVVRREAAAEEGTTVFAATHSLSRRFFPRWIGTAGEPRVRLYSASLPACLERLAAQHCHFALCHADGGLPAELDPASYRALPVGRDRIVPVAAPDALGRPKFDVAGRSGRSIRLLAYLPGSGLGRAVQARVAARKEARGFESVFESAFADVLRAMAIEGVGLAWLPADDAREALADGRLVRAGDDSWCFDLDILLLRAAGPLPDAAEAIWSRAAQRSVVRDPDIG